MNNRVAELAYSGNWAELLTLLRRSPQLINVASASKGYTTLHQAAWHGAGLPVVGELLALGADRSLKTLNSDQTAQAIVIAKHPGRVDLAYVLDPKPRTMAQLMRKVVSDTPDLFGPYDGNQTLCDRLIDCFGTDSCHHLADRVEARVDAAIRALTGATLASTGGIRCGPDASFELVAEMTFWKDRFLPLLSDAASKACSIPLEKEWAVIADLFDPPPEQWGLRGTPFLWMEMRQALCHVEIPQETESIDETISYAFAALTGVPLSREDDFQVKRFARGGMSSGMVSSHFWREEFIPLLRRRAKWLHESWRG